MEWKISHKPVPYEEAVAFMEARVEAIRQDTAEEVVWLLEHPALFTAGTGAVAADLLDPKGLPVYATGRGGQYTYHGPGQRVVYVMLDLKRRGPDLRQYVRNLEAWIIAALGGLNIKSFTREGRVGVWVDTSVKVSYSLPPCDGRLGRGVPMAMTEIATTPVLNPPPQGGRKSRETGMEQDINYANAPLPLLSAEAKIAAIGVRVRRWVSYHGIAVNVDPDLSHYHGIVPCGIREYGVTSLAALGVSADMAEVDRRLRESFDEVFMAV